MTTAIAEPYTKQMAAGRFRQLRLLLWKNWLFSLRSWKSTLLQLFAPCFFLVLVTALSYLPQGLKDIPDPTPSTIGTLPKCTGWNGKNCTSLLVLNIEFIMSNIAPGEDLELRQVSDSDSTIECIKELIEDFGRESGFQGTDIKMVLTLEQLIGLFYNPITKEYQNYFTEHVNQTQVAIAFMKCNMSVSAPKLEYVILYNSSRALKFQQLIFGSPNKPDGREEVAILLDSIFMSKVLGRNVSVAANASNFPRFFQQQSVVSKQAASTTTFLFCAITFQFIMMLYNIISEKELKLRQGLKLIGLKDSVYWFSWGITGLVIAFLSTCVLMATGYACQLQFFFNTQFFINFLLFFIYSLSMVPLAFFASVFISTVRQAVNIGMLIFVVGLMVISLLSNPFLLTQTYEYVPGLVVALSFLPPFHLAKSIADIGIAASDTGINGLPQTPHFFGWHDMVISREVISFDFSFKSINSHKYYMPPTYLSFIFLVLDMLLYAVLAWFLDAVIPGNHGIPRKLHFFLQPSYWLDWLPHWSKRPKGLTAPIILEDSDEEEEDDERTALLHRGVDRYGLVNPGDGIALRIRELTKTFRTGCCGWKHAKLPAVDRFTLDVQEHQILALLGHNGAGKTTTINMLIGLLEPDQGDAHFYGLSVRDGLDVIRSVLGVCPQHDVLWGDLTAREHMQLFGNLKDIPRQHMQEEIRTLLEEVQLNHVADYRVNTFSGGMKRRLSVALSFLGNPKIMFLDEPTTGMDPRVRRDIWNLVLRMKHDRVTIMTTHSMEEADILGDKIAIMANGQLRAMGTSVNLKNRFAGYKIELVVKHDSTQTIINLVKEKLPGATPTSEPIEVEGGILLPYNLSPDRHMEIVPFFKVLEGEQQLSTMILDYSISQTTLEEVFLNVTLNELFRDQTYQPILMRSGSYIASSPLSPLSPVTSPTQKMPDSGSF